jgi:hypothetical protein
MKQSRNWIIGIVLITATAGFIALQNGFVPAIATAIPTAAIIDTVTSAPAEEPCAFVWASHDSPELTQKVNAEIQAVNPKANVRAELYGEDCVYSDGHSTFGVMETDFHVNLPVDDLANEEALGNAMAQILPIIVNIPREEIQGKYGFVEFWFEKNETEHVVVRVPIQKYIDEAQGKTGTKLFRMFSAKQ